MTSRFAGTVPSFLKDHASLYSVSPHKAALEWFRKAEFGLFIHYALASLFPKGRIGLENMAGNEADALGALQHSPEMLDGLDLPNAVRTRCLGIKAELAARFTAERFDAEALCDLATRAGMKYVNFTTKHLGGLYMFRTSVSGFSAPEIIGRDLVAEMAEACNERGLGLFLYVPPDVSRTDDLYLEHNQTVLEELLTNYGPVAGIWFDGVGKRHKNPEQYTKLPEIYASIRELQPQCLISFKTGATGDEDFIAPEFFLFRYPVEWDTPYRQRSWERRLEHQRKRVLSNDVAGENTLLLMDRSLYKPAEISTTLQAARWRDGSEHTMDNGWIHHETSPRLTVEEVHFQKNIAHSQGANLILNVGLRGDGSVNPRDRDVLEKLRAD
ncbi:MAG: hypothetical protein HN742_08765 [Lentisphaerae bacterium]|jgi:alpha-L-fucosidase|nr:hypothetical protein [Lentisphaerota bacterium]MBT5611184.1 hypothetical protein [Lentisphaerota bacterium]MBT7054692.1 hypothetical protein [Lentisphaerota bacterium]MBT7841950.1 hypothetical protein [Lentisphaerota bacterium]